MQQVRLLLSAAPDHIANKLLFAYILHGVFLDISGVREYLPRQTIVE